MIRLKVWIYRKILWVLWMSKQRSARRFDRFNGRAWVPTIKQRHEAELKRCVPSNLDKVYWGMQ